MNIIKMLSTMQFIIESFQLNADMIIYKDKFIIVNFKILILFRVVKNMLKFFGLVKYFLLIYLFTDSTFLFVQI